MPKTNRKRKKVTNRKKKKRGSSVISQLERQMAMPQPTMKSFG